MQPGFPPPPPFKRFMRKAMVNKASQMLVQLQVGPQSSFCFQIMMCLHQTHRGLLHSNLQVTMPERFQLLGHPSHVRHGHNLNLRIVLRHRHLTAPCWARRRRLSAAPHQQRRRLASRVS